MAEPDCAVKAKESLIEKGILLKEGKLTKTAFFLIKLLKQYQESEEFVRFNNVMCAFLPDDEERVVALTERSQGKGYTLDYLKKREVYLSLISNVSFLVRAAA
ncbi:DUF5081 family protein [Bacillus paralicheniformis]|nr:DUF5081 family protein [Bacillus paralicheniformis]